MSAGRKSVSDKKDWNTPPKIISAVKLFWDGLIGLDPCSNSSSTVFAEKEFMLPQDGLKLEWNADTIFVNPPYGKSENSSIKAWFEKTALRSNKTEIIFLVPVATNTSHWKKYVFPAASSICFLFDTRLKFYENGLESTKGAPMSCCLIYWGGRQTDFKHCFSSLGYVVQLN